jgi:hypothetical protein
MEGNGQKCVPIITIQRALNVVIKKFGQLLKEVSMPFTSPSFADDMMYAKTMSYTFLSLNLSIDYTLMLQCVMIFLLILAKFVVLRMRVSLYCDNRNNVVPLGDTSGCFRQETVKSQF